MLRRKLAFLCLLFSGASGNVAVAQDFSAQNSGVIAPSAPDWTRTYSPDIPYRNVTDGGVNIRLGPGTDHDITGRLMPGEGGFIIGCNDRVD